MAQNDPQRYRDILNGVEFAGRQRNRAYFDTPEEPGLIFGAPYACRQSG